MIALRVSLNGVPLCVAGAEDLAVLNTIVNAVGNLGALTKKVRDEPPDLFLSVGGLTARSQEPDEHVRWREQHRLQVGDKIEIEIVETVRADPPERTSAHDKERQMEREREEYEYAKEVYFHFRPRFEPESGPA